MCFLKGALANCLQSAGYGWTSLQLTISSTWLMLNFSREAGMQACFHHPNIPQLVCWMANADQSYTLVMECMDDSLEDLLNFLMKDGQKARHGPFSYCGSSGHHLADCKRGWSTCTISASCTMTRNGRTPWWGSLISDCAMGMRPRGVGIFFR